MVYLSNKQGIWLLVPGFVKSHASTFPLCRYRRALLEHPGCPAEVRLGIAACMFKLGDLSGATAAYERVLALDPDCATAHLGLAIIKFNSINLQQVG
jgi:RNA polymerase-associated protein CTR9